MDALRRYLYSIALALIRLAPRGGAVRRILQRPLRLGIASRLAVAFVSVGALVLAANLIVETGGWVEKTTEITRTVPVVRPSGRTPQALSVNAALSAASHSPELLLALEQFSRAVQARAAHQDEQSEAERQRSSAQLELALHALTLHGSALSGRSGAALTARIRAHRSHGEDLIAVADERERVMKQYALLLEQLNVRVEATLKHAWTIFGRVLARESLLQLSGEIDTLQRNSAVLATAQRADDPQLAALLSSEQALTSSLQHNQRSLRRSQGDDWYQQLDGEVSQLASLRLLMLPLNQRLQSDQSTFEQESVELGTSIARQLGTPAVVPRAAARDTALTALPAPVVETHSVVTRTPPAQSRRSTIAWISATVLLLVAFISLSAVLSIVQPVRRLIAATSRIAKGDHAVRVERGGIKELDALAVAFNAMADELSIAKAAARDYQQSLEAKVTERTQQLEALAKHDPLTGLPNRRELFALLNAAIGRARTVRERVGVFFLDIDNFKYINDAMGHAFGDRLLLSFAQLLQSTTRSFGFAARLGGDEFTVVFERAARVEDIRAAGLRLVQAFQRPLSVDGRQLVVSVSVGVSIYPDHEQDAEALLKAADAALFRAKSLGRNQLATYTPELVAAAAAKFRTEQALRRAIDRGEFELLFQPELGVSTLQTALVEALIRWRLPDGRLASPHEFLSVAEESGLIVDINDWVLRSAMQAAAQWHHGCWPDARVAINVSPRQLLDHRFVERLESLLREHRLPAQCIEIELTESVLQTGPSTIEALKYLRSRGVAIALDDFGTGYSSLASLEQLPLSRIKLDASLIARIDENARSAAIARAIISLCEGLGLEITAEGIERPQQLAFLLPHRTMYLQGYLLAPPVAADELMTVMNGLLQRAEALLLDAQPLAVRDFDSTVGAPRLGQDFSALRG